MTSRLSGWVSHASELLERYQGLIAALLLLFVVLSALGVSAHRLFTYDEQITWRTAQMPVCEIWSFYSQGLDTTGPIPTLLAHLALALRMSPEIAIRVPFILAFTGMCWGLWSFLRVRYSAGTALVALVLPLEFVELCYFRTDARAYALMLLAAGAGLRLWQLASEGKSRPWSVLGLWFVLALGMSAHFYTVFLFVPFALAQLALDHGRRRIDWPVWSALVLFPVGWLTVAPGELRAHALYAGNFWTRPTAENLTDAYELMIMRNWNLIFVLGLFVFFLALYFWRSTHAPEQRDIQPVHEGLRTAEWVLVTALVLLPILDWCAAHMIGVFQYIYTIAFVAGLVVAIAAAAAEISKRQAKVGLVLFVMVLGLVLNDRNLFDAVNGVSALFDHGEAHQANAKHFQELDWVRWLNESQLYVVSDNDTHVKLMLYGSPQLAKRSYALTNFPAEKKFPRAMTDQNNMKLFGKQLGFQVEDITEFSRQHPRFVLVQQRPRFSFEWIASYLLDVEHQSSSPQMQVRFMSADGKIMLFEVSR